MHCLQKGPYFKDLLLNKDLFGILGPYLYFRVLIFTILVSFTQRMSIQCACIQQCSLKCACIQQCSLKPSFAHENCLIFAGIGSGLHCYQFFIFTYAYALIFIHPCFGSLFWLLGVLIRSLFHKKKGSLSQRLGVLISFGGSVNVKEQTKPICY